MKRSESLKKQHVSIRSFPGPTIRFHPIKNVNDFASKVIKEADLLRRLKIDMTVLQLSVVETSLTNKARS